MEHALQGNLVIVESRGIDAHAGAAGRAAVKDGLAALAHHGRGGFPHLGAAHRLDSHFHAAAIRRQGAHGFDLIGHLGVVDQPFDTELLRHPQALRRPTAQNHPGAAACCHGRQHQAAGSVAIHHHGVPGRKSGQVQAVEHAGQRLGDAGDGKGETVGKG